MNPRIYPHSLKTIAATLVIAGLLLLAAAIYKSSVSHEDKYLLHTHPLYDPVGMAQQERPSTLCPTAIYDAPHGELRMCP